MRGDVAAEVTLTGVAAACLSTTFVMLRQHVAFAMPSEAGTGPRLARLR
jgi:hypothetical protein